MEQVITWLKERKILCGFLFLFSISAVFMTLYISEVTAEEAYVCPKEEVANTVVEEVEDEFVTVDIKGAVVNPGVYRVTKNSIVNDVIVLAGGLLEEADTSNINLSKVVSSEMMITIYTKDEVANQKKAEAIVEEKNDDDSSLNEELTTLVNLNTADVEELMLLPGIGESKANLIIQYRENCGPFTSKEELMYIKGIGEAIYAKLESYITV
ncbi:TPA: ComEA family DNA-binding protein [Candidatus Ventrenecus avicola]|nr:ComEA family DNA-binding protein [Candidatus Ventrenecus avicola]